MDGYELASAYHKGELCGWHGRRYPELVASAYRNVSYLFRDFQIVGQTRPTAGRKAMLYQAARKALGKDTDNYRQEIGDCVSFGAKNATEYITCTDMVMNGKNEKFRPIFPPFYYGSGRIFIGKHQIPDSEDGSMGSWMAAAVLQYGALFSDESGVPQYAGSVAKKWGGGQGPPSNFVDIAKQHLIHSAALIKSWDDLVAALVNGYAVTTASNIGYDMEPGSDGFHRQTQNWGHQMCFIGADETYSEPYAIILNSWADCHGHLKDFESSEDLPIGVLRVRRADAEKHINAGETFAYSQFDGFPEQDLDAKLFKVVGN